MEIRGDSMFISGGMHNQTQSVGGHNDNHSTVTTAVVNKAQEQKIIPFRGTDGTLFVDNIGSFIVRKEGDVIGYEGEDGEMEFNNGLGAKLFLQRGWKRSGLPNPNNAAPIVAGVVAPVGAAMQRENFSGNKVVPADESPIEKIAGLKKLLDMGALTQEEFDQKKGALLAQM